MKRPSAIAPFAMSLICLGMVMVHTLMFGVVHEADEGTPAHIFQLLMVLQIPVVALFALKWFPRNPRETVLVLAMQVGAAATAIVSVLPLT